jgi:hypothetical protein
MTQHAGSITSPIMDLGPVDGAEVAFVEVEVAFVEVEDAFVVAAFSCAFATTTAMAKISAPAIPA